MRYYDLKIFKTGSATPYRHWTSKPNGKYDPAALNIIFDILTASYGQPFGAQMITVEGVPLSDLAQSQQFAGMQLVLSAGMDSGLPLANPKQIGVIFSGEIYQCYGNWQGTDMTLDFVATPSSYTLDNPGYFVLRWMKGVELADALKTTLQQAYPDYVIQMNISGGFVQKHDEPHRCSTLEQLASWVAQITKKRFNNEVHITVQAGQIIVADNSYSPPPVDIQFQDLVGQPVWIGVDQIQVKTVLRGDISLYSRIKLPEGLLNTPGFVTTSTAAYPSSEKYKTTFNGAFTVSEMRQIGQYRASDGTSWVSLINCIPNG